jgi:hypothetical protein
LHVRITRIWSRVFVDSIVVVIIILDFFYVRRRVDPAYLIETQVVGGVHPPDPSHEEPLATCPPLLRIIVVLFILAFVFFFLLRILRISVVFFNCIEEKRPISSVYSI